MPTPPRSAVWVDTLDVAALRVLLGLAWRRGCGPVRFLRASRAGLLVLRVLTVVGRIRVTRDAVRLDESELRTAAGGAVWFEIRREILRLVAALRTCLPPTDDLVGRLPSCLSRERARLFLEKRLADELYDLVLLRCHARYRRRKTGSADVILVHERAWLGPVALLLRDDDVAILACRGRGGGRAFRAVLRSLVLRPGALLAAAVLAALRGWRADGGGAGSRSPTLAVGHKWGVDGTRMSDVFFQPGSGIDPGQILVYFDDRNRPLTEQGLRAVEAAGMRWVVRRAGCSRLPRVGAWPGSREYARRWIVTAGTIVRLAGAALFRSRAVGRWQFWHLVHLLTVIDNWAAFYRAFGVRVDFHKEECDPESVARAMALELVNGVSIGCHWSFYQFTTVEHSRAQHVYFAWGQHYAAFLAEDGSRVEHLVYVGHIFDHYFEGAGRRRAELREVLARRGAQFILCLFDDSFGPGGPTPRAAVVHFYRFFVERIEADSTLGLIVKSKSPEHLLADSELAVLLRRAEATGRCLFLGAEADPGRDISAAMRWLPVEAAVGADISVALGLPTNSAAIQVALAGLRSVSWDAAGHFAHPFYTWGHERVVFENLERLFLAIQEYRADPLRHADLGDYKPVLEEIDPYRDGQAALRMGRYVAQLLRGLESGLDRREAVEVTNRAFRDRCGHWAIETFV